MTAQPDKAAEFAKLAFKSLGADRASDYTDAYVQGAAWAWKKLGGPEGRALAEAVLKIHSTLGVKHKTPRADCLACDLVLPARAYLAALDGITQPDASHRVGDSPSSDAKAQDRESP